MVFHFERIVPKVCGENEKYSWSELRREAANTLAEEILKHITAKKRVEQDFLPVGPADVYKFSFDTRSLDQDYDEQYPDRIHLP